MVPLFDPENVGEGRTLLPMMVLGCVHVGYRHPESFQRVSALGVDAVGTR